ncbi:TIGR03758 family integrating conjugative element protein [Saezia sanguinis]|uniref:TIGR03758 family integrating conjugative element protein n=1 Tax=Saezia sanguinis TaxID=1965230 RepID=UPI003068419C
MSLSTDQLNAFKVNGGFEPDAVATLLLCVVFVVLLVWGIWAIRSAYSCWAVNDLSHKEFALVVVRFALMYLVLTFLLLS